MEMDIVIMAVQEMVYVLVILAGIQQLTVQLVHLVGTQ